MGLEMAKSTRKESRTLCLRLFLMLIGSLAAAPVANAQLIPNPDGLTVYDVTFQVNWAANANLAHDPVLQIENVNPSGSMDFATARKFLAFLNSMNGTGYLKHDTWQLPATPFKDSSCDSTGPKPQENNFGYGCTGSAMGALYNNEGEFHIPFPDTAVLMPDVPSGPFHNFQPYIYWSDSDAPGPTSGYHAFSFNTGFVGANVDKHQMYVLPMIFGKAVNTTFHDSGVPGLQVSDDGLLVYDKIAGYTWPSDANLAKSEKFRTPLCADLKGETFCINDDGSMPHTIAEAWVTNMSLNAYAGQTNWVLPPIGNDDPSCSVQHTKPEDDFGFNCDGNPLGILYYDRLKLQAGTPLVTAPNIDIHGFNNLQPYLYWGCTLADNSINLCQDAPPAEGFQWSFSFGNGFQGTDVVGNTLYVMVYYPESIAQALAEGITEYLGTGPQAQAFLSQAAEIGSAPTLEAKAGRLQAFIHHVNAQRGKALIPAVADYLIALAEAL
jgi:hypothetical protein